MLLPTVVGALGANTARERACAARVVAAHAGDAAGLR